MIELSLIAITWYITKLFYTRDIRINIPQRESDLMDAICVKCSQTIVIHKENIRTPFYCMVCK